MFLSILYHFQVLKKWKKKWDEPLSQKATHSLVVRSPKNFCLSSLTFNINNVKICVCLTYTYNE